MSPATIGSALIEQRQKLGLDKSQAAEKIGMSRTTYSSYELDTQRPSVDVFPALAEFLHVSTEELLTLYGATSIAVARLSLTRVLPTDDEELREPVADLEGAQFNDGSDATAEAEITEADVEQLGAESVDVEAADVGATDFEEMNAVGPDAEPEKPGESAAYAELPSAESVDEGVSDNAPTDFEEVNALEEEDDSVDESDGVMASDVEDTTPWVSSVTPIDVAIAKKGKKPKKKKHRGKKK
jgi:transcriptional regulator with XRE-family HTH domain